MSRRNLQIHGVSAEIRTWIPISVPIYVSTLTCGISMTLNSCLHRNIVKDNDREIKMFIHIFKLETVHDLHYFCWKFSISIWNNRWNTKNKIAPFLFLRYYLSSLYLRLIQEVLIIRFGMHLSCISGSISSDGAYLHNLLFNWISKMTEIHGIRNVEMLLKMQSAPRICLFRDIYIYTNI